MSGRSSCTRGRHRDLERIRRTRQRLAARRSTSLRPRTMVAPVAPGLHRRGVLCGIRCHPSSKIVPDGQPISNAIPNQRLIGNRPLHATGLPGARLEQTPGKSAPPATVPSTNQDNATSRAWRPVSVPGAPAGSSCGSYGSMPGRHRELPQRVTVRSFTPQPRHCQQPTTGISRQATSCGGSPALSPWGRPCQPSRQRPRTG